MPRHDDDDDRPRRRRRDDDEDDRPRRRSRDDEDEDDERPRSRRKSRRDYDDQYEDRPRRKSRPKGKELNVVGLVALVISVLALLLSFNPCISQWYAVGGGLLGMLVALGGLWMSQQSDGRQGTALAFSAMGVSALAIVIALLWLLLFRVVEQEFKKAGDAHRRQVERTAQEVQAETNPTRVTAEVLAREWEHDEEQTDARYDGKVLEVTGIVDLVDFGELEHEYRVELRTETGPAVCCDFLKSPEIEARLKQLKPGDRVTIRGKYKLYFGEVVLEGCLLVK